MIVSKTIREGSNPSTPAIVVTHYSSPTLEACLQSLSLSGDFELAVVDTKASNIPLAAAWNWAMKTYWDRPAIIITNDDVIFEPDSCDLLVDSLLNRQYIEHPHPRELLVVKAWDKKCRRYYHHEELLNGWRNYGGEGWFCFVTSRKLFEVCGEFDENFSPAYGEDTDMTYRVYKAGYAVMSYPGVWHESGSTSTNDPERAALVAARVDELQDYFYRKHGVRHDGDEVRGLLEI